MSIKGIIPKSKKAIFCLKEVLLTLESSDFDDKVKKCYYKVPGKFGENWKSNY